jgi:hypothetical protein
MHLSYRGIRRYTGVSSDSTVARVLQRFSAMHILQICRSMGENGFRSCNSYALTLDDPQLKKAMQEIWESERQEIEAERELRKEQRQFRQAEIASRKPAKRDPLAPDNFAATDSGERIRRRSSLVGVIYTSNTRSAEPTIRLLSIRFVELIQKRKSVLATKRETTPMAYLQL